MKSDRQMEQKSIDSYAIRYQAHWPRLVELLQGVYTDRPDLDQHLARLGQVCETAWQNRSLQRRTLDTHPGQSQPWFMSEQAIGMTLYVDLFAHTFDGLRQKLDYFEQLGITYLHLMPLFKVPPGENDGGYAVSDYRETREDLGSIESLRTLIEELKARGIAVAVDFIFNHTADDHPWALKAKGGDSRYLKFFYTFDDKDIPNAFEQTLREIFPETRRGSFSWNCELNRWVWTTFNSFQWDLNYSNPDVFVSMAEEMLFLANLGVDVLRLDAVAFLWKRMGTTCENLHEAHTLIQALNQVCRIAAPSLVFKSEAIVHPDDVVRYIAPHECQLSYNPTLMALLWEAAATRETKLLVQSLSHRQALTAQTNWVNYLRCHDDIGWSFDDGDAWSVGIDPHGHRRFLNRFYTGQFPGSFARGVPFQYNPTTQDMRVCGTFASLVGLEDAGGDETLYLMASKRARMLFGVLMSIGGIPLIYAGEECGFLNDHTYLDDPNRRGDARWVHRLAMNWSDDGHSNPSTVGQTLSGILKELITVRKSISAFAGTDIEVVKTPSPHLLAFWRRSRTQSVLVVANFSEQHVPVDGGLFGADLPSVQFKDVLGPQVLSDDTLLEPYCLHWSIPAKRKIT